MKKILLSISLMTGAAALHAQSVETANQFYYYERYQSSENGFHTLLKQEPGNAEAWYGLTRAYLAQDEGARAADSLRLAPSDIHSEPFYQVAYGSLLLHQNKKDSAAIFFNSALKETKEKEE